MTTKYRQLEDGSTEVEDLTTPPPVVDVAKLQDELDKLKQTRDELIENYNSSIQSLNTEIDFKQTKLQEIYAEVPEVQELVDNQ